MTATDGLIQLTAEGRARLAEELVYLTEVKRPDLSRRILDANEHGNVSDNSEYEELKEALILTDVKIQELESTIARAEIIEPPKGGVIGLGSTIKLRADDGEVESWRLVSHEEADTRVGAISTDSPVGQALYGRAKGETIVVEAPSGQIEYTIVKVS